MTDERTAVHHRPRSYGQLWIRALVVGFIVSTGTQIGINWPLSSILPRLTSHGRWMLGFWWVIVALLVATVLAFITWLQNRTSAGPRSAE